MDGKACFGENYYMFRHEDLLLEPATSVEALYGFMGLSIPENVRAWVDKNVRGRPGYHLSDDPMWSETIHRLGLENEMNGCGYSV